MEQFKDESAHSKGNCWCPACEADVMALSLTSLRPRYHTCFGDEEHLRDEEFESVRRALEDAAGRVGRFPRHGSVGSSSPQVRLINFNVEEGAEIVEALTAESALPCGCLKCCSDILTYSLNRVAPRYGVERDGQVSLPREAREDIRQQVAVMIALATKVMAGRPAPLGHG